MRTAASRGRAAANQSDKQTPVLGKVQPGAAASWSGPNASDTYAEGAPTAGCSAGNFHQIDILNPERDRSPDFQVGGRECGMR